MMFAELLFLASFYKPAQVCIADYKLYQKPIEAVKTLTKDEIKNIMNKRRNSMRDFHRSA